MASYEMLMPPEIKALESEAPMRDRDWPGGVGQSLSVVPGLENRPVKGVAKVLGTEAGHTLPPQLVQMPPALPAQLAISKVIRRPVKSQPRVALGPGSRNHRMGTDRGTSSSAAEALALQLGLGGRGQRARGGVLAQVSSSRGLVGAVVAGGRVGQEG